MKILFVQPTGDKRGHYGLWTSQLCQAIAEHGEDLCLLTNKIYPEKYLKEAPKFRIIELKGGNYRFDAFDQVKDSRHREAVLSEAKELPLNTRRSFVATLLRMTTPQARNDVLTRSPLFYWYGYFRNTFLMVRAAIKLCRKEKFDVLYLTDVEYMTAALLLKFSKKLPPVIWHVQAANFSYDSYAGSRLKKMYKVFQRSIFKSILGRQVKAFAVLGEYHQRTLREQLKLPNQFLIDVIPDGADTIEHSISQRESRDKIGVQTDAPVFLFFGMLRRDKGIEYLIEAIAIIASETKLSSFLKPGSPRLNAPQPRDSVDFKLIIAGAPFEWSEEELKNLIQKYKVEDFIELRLGYIPDEDVQYYYAACDVVVFPYHQNYTGGCGPLTKGACAYHKPVIASDVSDLGRMVEKNQLGWAVPPGDAKALALAMQEFLDISEDLKNNVIENIKHCAKEHAWPMVGKKFLTLAKNISGECYVN